MELSGGTGETARVLNEKRRLMSFSPTKIQNFDVLRFLFALSAVHVPVLWTRMVLKIGLTQMADVSVDNHATNVIIASMCYHI